jgi:low affinity Fe/Cu permease
MDKGSPLDERSQTGRQSAAWFETFAGHISRMAGKPAAFLVAVLAVIIWALTGPIFHFGETWQLVINTGTTIITFIMVFLIQNTQNRDTVALQLKLDELVLATRGARDELACLEEGSEKDIEAAREEVRARAAKQTHHGSNSLRVGASDVEGRSTDPSRTTRPRGIRPVVRKP